MVDHRPEALLFSLLSNAETWTNILNWDETVKKVLDAEESA